MSNIIPIIPQTDAAPTANGADAHVASLVVQVRPEALNAIEQQIQQMPECTCYKDTPEGTTSKDSVLVVVLEVETTAEINNVIDRLNQITGVLNVNLVYHYSDSAESMTDETEISQ